MSDDDFLRGEVYRSHDVIEKLRMQASRHETEARGLREMLIHKRVEVRDLRQANAEDRAARLAQVDRLRELGDRLADAVRALDSYAALGGAPMERTDRADAALRAWESLR